MNQDLTQELAAAQAELVASKEATARAEAKIAAVQAELASPTPWKRWKPTKEQRYYYATSQGGVGDMRWLDWKMDAGYYDFGNCFPTCEAAERHAKRIRSMVPTCPVPKDNEGVWWVNLASSARVKHGIYFGGESDIALYNLGRIFATEEAAQAWIDEFADAWTTLEDAS